MTIKFFLSSLAIVLTAVAYLPYIRSIQQGQTRPHVFSWFIWGISTFVVFLAQLADKGGAGAWPIGLSGLITIYVAALAYRQMKVFDITAMDWCFLVVAISSLPLWYWTADPLWAVVILTTIDVLGFGPTFRKAYHHPFEEQLLFFVLMTIRNFLVILALENYSLTTVLFPAAVNIMCVLFIVMVVYRRRVSGSRSGK